jgi:hypothetical protein
VELGPTVAVATKKEGGPRSIRPLMRLTRSVRDPGYEFVPIRTTSLTITVSRYSPSAS